MEPFWLLFSGLKSLRLVEVVLDLFMEAVV